VKRIQLIPEKSTVLSVGSKPCWKCWHWSDWHM